MEYRHRQTSSAEEENKQHTSRKTTFLVYCVGAQAETDTGTNTNTNTNTHTHTDQARETANEQDQDRAHKALH